MQTKLKGMIGLLVILMGLTNCASLDATPTAIAPGKTSPPSVSTMPSLPATPIPTPTPQPTVMNNLPCLVIPPQFSPTSNTGRWQCDPSGGLTCFGDFTYIDMISAEEGWAYGEGGEVLHYITVPGDTSPTWQQSHILKAGLTHCTMVSPTEGWAILGGQIYHYRNGEWQEGGTRGSVTDLSMVSADEGWAVGYSGRLFDYQQGKWHTITGPIDRVLHGVTMLNAEEGWAVGEGVMLHYQSPFWERTLEKYFLLDIEFINPDEGWAIGSAILHYQNGKWQEVHKLNTVGSNSSQAEGSLRDMSFVDANEAWAVGGYGTIYHYHNGVWQAVESPTRTFLVSIDMVDATEGWAVGDNNTMLHYQDGRWQTITEGISFAPELTDVVGLSDGTGWAVGRNGIFWRDKNGDWQPVDVSLHNPDQDFLLQAIDMVNPEEGWSVGQDGIVLHYTQGQWQQVASPTVNSLSDIDMLNSQEGWMVGPKSGIFHYTNGEWQRVKLPNLVHPKARAIDMLNENEGWATGDDGVLHYHNGVWSFDYYRKFNDIDMVDEQTGWAVGEDGLVMRYQDGVWQQVEIFTSYNLHTVVASTPDEVWVSDTKDIWHYVDGQWQQEQRPGNFTIRSIKMLNENEGWAVGDGILHYLKE